MILVSEADAVGKLTFSRPRFLVFFAAPKQKKRLNEIKGQLGHVVDPFICAELGELAVWVSGTLLLFFQLFFCRGVFCFRR